MVALRRRLPDVITALDGRLGIECTSCRTKLKLNGRPVAAAMATSCVVALIVFSLSGLDTRAHTSSAGVLASLLVVLAYRYAQRFATIRRAQPDEQLVYAADLIEGLDTQLEQRRREDEAAGLEEYKRVEEINDPTRSEWTCSACSSENPATFDICWHCQAVREADSNHALHRAHPRR